MPYQSHSNIANLLMRQGQIEGQREMERGQAYGQLGQNLAQIAGSTISDVLKFQADEPRRKLQDIQLKEQEREQWGKKLTGDLVITHTKNGITDHDAVAGALEENGLTEVAQSYRDKVTDRQDKITSKMLEHVSQQGSALSKLMTIGEEAAKNPTRYKTHLRQQAVDIANAAGIPADQIPADYDPATFGPIMANLQKRVETFQADERTLKLVDLGRKRAIDTLTFDKAMVGAANEAISTTTSQEEFNQAMANLANAGVPQSVRDKFGNVWSPEVAQNALKGRMTPGEIATLEAKQTEGLNGYLKSVAKGRTLSPQEIIDHTSAYESAMKGDGLSRHLAARARAKGSELTPQEELKYKREWEAAGHFAAASTQTGSLKFENVLKQRNAERASQGLGPLDSAGEIALNREVNASNSRAAEPGTGPTEVELRRQYQDYLAGIRIENAANAATDQPLVKPLNRKKWQAEEYGTAAPGPDEDDAKVEPPPPSAEEIALLRARGPLPTPPPRPASLGGGPGPGAPSVPEAVRSKVADLLRENRQPVTDANIQAFVSDARNQAQLEALGIRQSDLATLLRPPARPPAPVPPLRPPAPPAPPQPVLVGGGRRPLAPPTPPMPVVRPPGRR